MSSAIHDVEHGHAAAASGARDALQVRARLLLDVLKAAISNRAKRDAIDVEQFVRNLAQVKEILAELGDLVDAGSMPPPKPWWSDIWAQFKSALLMAGVGHGHVGLS